MNPEDVPAELVEKAARATNVTSLAVKPGYERTLRTILAAVLPEIQAQARKEAERERDVARAEAAEYLRMASSVSQSASRIVSSRAAARIRDTGKVVPITD